MFRVCMVCSRVEFECDNPSCLHVVLRHPQRNDIVCECECECDDVHHTHVCAYVFRARARIVSRPRSAMGRWRSSDTTRDNDEDGGACSVCSRQCVWFWMWMWMGAWEYANVNVYITFDARRNGGWWHNPRARKGRARSNIHTQTYTHIHNHTDRRVRFVCRCRRLEWRILEGESTIVRCVFYFLGCIVILYHVHE